MNKKLIYIVEKGGLSNSENKIAHENDKIIKPKYFQFIKFDDLKESHLESIDFIILEDEGKNQIQLLKAISDLDEINKIIVCDNLDIFSQLIEKIIEGPKIITLDYKIGGKKTTEKLPDLYKKIKLKFQEVAIVGYTNYARIKKDNNFSESSADELTKLIREKGDSVISKIDMNEKVLSAILYDKLQISQMRELMTKSKYVINELKSEQKVTVNILNKFLDNYVESVKFSQLFPPLIGNAQSIRLVKYFIEVFSKDDSAILITGESGTGKELVAKAIHHLSRPGKPFVEVSPAIPEELIESELFGHEKGSFTNAINERIGKFEEADGGILFLDEIADISMNVQAKILRAIQEKVIVRVGGKKKIPTDVKLVTATNKDLAELIRLDKFREDLFHRINSTFPKLPALRERKEDIPLLINYFLTAKKSESHFSNDTITYLQNLPWKGNVRELKKVIEQTSALFSGKRIIEINEVQLVINMLLEKNKPANSVDQVETPLQQKSKINVEASDCFEAKDLLDKIHKIVSDNYKSEVEITQEQIANHFITVTGKYGCSRKEFSQKYFSPHKDCIKKLISIDNIWKETTEKCSFLRKLKPKM